ncbi:MAG: glycosyltransferase [Candidatus Peribacteraceae bacterium]
MRIAIVADWLTTYGGAEHVLEQLYALWPKAPFFTTVARPANVGPLSTADIRTTSLQHLYRLTKNHQMLLPLMPRAIESIDLSGFDVVLSSSHAVAKGVIVPPTARHICYCHTPMRYAWEMEEEYLRDFNIRWPLKKPIKKMLGKIRRWDLATTQRVDHFISNSSETQRRIKNIYGRDSVVVPPPVSERFFSYDRAKNGALEYYLALGRMVPYKRFDLLIELANKLRLPLKIGGVGSEFAALKKMAGPTVEFLGFVSDDDLPSLYAGAKALLFPQYEDAGIVPMEAMACGTPVIAYGKGGVTDVIEDAVTGILVPDQSVEAFETALKRFESMQFNSESVRAAVMKFHEKEFQKKILAAVGAAPLLSA